MRRFAFSPLASVSRLRVLSKTEVISPALSKVIFSSSFSRWVAETESGEVLLLAPPETTCAPVQPSGLISATGAAKLVEPSAATSFCTG
ncbi:hypothetical protein D9M68_942230 [compost metagenome]